MVADRWITDWEPSQRLPVYTRANAGEVLPDPASPLGWTLVWEQGVLMGWRDSQVRVGTMAEHELDTHRPEIVGSFAGYLYINVSTARLFGVRAPGLSAQMVDDIYFGTHPDVPPYVPEPWHESPASTERLGAWMAQVMTAVDLPELREDRERADAARASRPNLGQLTDEALVQRARSFLPLIRHLFDRHLEITAGASIGLGALGAIAEALGEPTLVLTLITSVGDIDSAAPSYAMWRLSRLDPRSEDYADGFRQLLYDFGSRGPNEWDIRSDTWETNPQLAESLIDAMRRAPDAESPAHRNEKNAQARRDAEQRVRSALEGQPELVAQFESALRSAHLYLAGRERTKTNIVKVIHEVRMAIRELAERHDYTMSQVCMLLADELDAFVNDPNEFRPRLAAREQQYLELFELEPPFIVNGSVAPLSEWPRRGTATFGHVAEGEVLTGMPGAPGSYTGRARILLDPSDPTALEPGEVLVAPITDPSWTPLFVPAGAVVVDVGALVSHAVIVSRELGIPCAVSVKDATKRIPNGATVTVDGTTGTVTVVQLP